jgi:hypothetical protein
MAPHRVAQARRHRVELGLLVEHRRRAQREGALPVFLGGEGGEDDRGGG